MNKICVKTPPCVMRQNNQPKLPAMLARPFTLIPEPLPSVIIVKALNMVLAQALRDGDLGFLAQHQVSVAITDLKLKFALGLSKDRLVAKKWQAVDDLNISGGLYDFMLLASRQEDSDTLFFHRRLKMQGSTDLGLEVKNLLDGMDIDTIPFHQQLNLTLRHGIKLFETLFK